MSNLHLPSEILDYTIDLLHDEPATLKQCCLVSKSWVPRTRRHLFADINFNSFDDFEAWEKAFPDPANSPAYHTRSLFVGFPRSVTAADAEEGGWILAFSRVVRLELHTHPYHNPEASLIPFHNFSPALKSLRVVNLLPRSQVFELVCSLPLLEDLNIQEYQVDEADYGKVGFQPLTSPPLTGSFELDTEEAGPTIRRLLDLPGGFHFRELILTWRNEEDLRWFMELVVGCSDTLECFDIWETTCTDKQPTHIDFSKATRLKDVTFRCQSLDATWIDMALQTITPDHRDLQHITIYVPCYHEISSGKPVNLRQLIGEARYRQWVDLDSLLVQFLESRAIRTKVMYGVGSKEEKLEMCEHMGSLLPRIADGGTMQPFVYRGGGIITGSRSEEW